MSAPQHKTFAYVLASNNQVICGDASRVPVHSVVTHSLLLRAVPQGHGRSRSSAHVAETCTRRQHSHQGPFHCMINSHLFKRIRLSNHNDVSHELIALAANLCARQGQRMRRGICTLREGKSVHLLGDCGMEAQDE